MSSPPADLEKHTIALWQPRADRVLQENDTRLMVDNIRGFMSVLQEWQAKKEVENAPSH